MKPVTKSKFKILVTAGSTWVSIDRVRVITNVFKGELGCVIARKMRDAGHEVTLVIGPGTDYFDNMEGIRIIRFKFFDELFLTMRKLIATLEYHVVIHSAAVSDYAPCKTYFGKIKSDKKSLVIKLKKTIKIVDLIKKWNPETLLVKFKLEVNVSKKRLFNIAKKSLLKSRADYIIANDYISMKNGYLAYLFNKDGYLYTCDSKNSVAESLVNILKQHE